MPDAELRKVRDISIHAARVGCDHELNIETRPQAISIQAARVGCDICEAMAPGKFRLIHFNPRSPSGLRRCFLFVDVGEADISIHAARVGCDINDFAQTVDDTIFQSTQPEWAATRNVGRKSR